MKIDLYGCFQLDAPEGFVIEESKVIFEAAPKEDLYDAELAFLGKQLSKQKPPPTAVANILVKRRQIDPQTNLPFLAMDLAAKSLHNLGSSLEKLETQPFVFADQKEGVLISFCLPAGRFQLRQTHLFRLDGELLTQATWTRDDRTLSPTEESEGMAFLKTRLPVEDKDGPPPRCLLQDRSKSP